MTRLLRKWTAKAQAQYYLSVAITISLEYVMDTWQSVRAINLPKIQYLIQHLPLSNKLILFCFGSKLVT